MLLFSVALLNLIMRHVGHSEETATHVKLTFHHCYTLLFLLELFKNVVSLIDKIWDYEQF